MSKLFLDTDDKDLDRLFSEAKRFPLLTPEREQQLDREKWEAVWQLQLSMLADTTCRAYLSRWARACSENPPEIGRFANREHYFLLRRELADLQGEKNATALGSLATPGAADHATDTQLVKDLAMPATLAVGLAETLLSQAGKADPGGVAGALLAWQAQWPKVEDPLPQGLDAITQQRLAKHVRSYMTVRDTLVSHNMRLVFSIAGGFGDKGVSFLDLVQEGTLGLIRAAEKFTFERGYRFSTYAYNWIAQSVRRCAQDTGALIRYPGHIQEQLGKLYGTRAELLTEDGRAPGDARLGQDLGLSPKKTHELLQLRNRAISLDTPRFDDEENNTLLDSTPGGPFATPESEAQQDSLKQFLLSEINRLDPAEQRVVISRWGLDQQRPQTRAEIAEQMAVSREWVRQLESSALEKLGRNEQVFAAYLDSESA